MLGDVLTSTIIADQLKITYPNSHIDYLVVKHAVALVKEHPSIDGIVAVNQSDFNTLDGIISLSRKLKNSSYDLLIDVYGKNNSALLSYLTKIPKRIGYKKWFSSVAYTIALKNSPDRSIYKQGISLGSRLLLTQPMVDNVQWKLLPKIYLTTAEKDQGKKWLEKSNLDLDRKITMIAVLGSSMEKTLPFEKMAQLLDYHVEQSGSQILFNYIPSQTGEAYQIFSLCKTKTQKFIFIEAFAPSIREFLSVLSNCDAMVGNEGGAINMAKALAIPTYTIFSPWITKEVWNAGEDGKKHISVHLKDFNPELYRKGSNQDRKKIAVSLYEQFKVDDFKKSLNTFISENLK